MVNHLQHFTYLEQCIAAVEAVNDAELAELQLGEAVGHGTGFVTHRLGELSVGYAGHVAVKLPKRGRTSWERILHELTDMQLLSGEDVALRAQLPAFLGLITVGGQDVAVLTEDATRGGSVRLTASTTEPSTEAAIRAQLPEGIALRETARFYMSYLAGTTERLLDATLTPLSGNLSQRTALFHEIYGVLPRLTKVVAPQSPLGQSLVAPRSYSS